MVWERTWTKEEDDIIATCVANGASNAEACSLLPGKTANAVRAKLNSLKRKLRSKAQAKQNRKAAGKSETPRASGKTSKPNVEDEVVGDRRAIYVRRTHICTEEEFLAAYKIDADVWELERLKFNQWEMGAVIDGEVVVTPLYQVTGIFARRKALIAVRQEIEALKSDLKSLTTFAPLNVYPASFRRPCALEISIPDLHMGKESTLEETGATYTLDIAERLFAYAVEHHVRAASTCEIERICFVAGNDILNVDNSAHETTARTPQLNCARSFVAFRRTRLLLQACIQRCAKLAPVDVLMVPGNHDYDSVYMLGDSLECSFHGNRDVVIHNHASARKIWHYGASLIMFTHGNEEKSEDLPLLLATESNSLWGQTIYHEIHCGHTHRSCVTEKMGVRTRVLSSLSAADAWHARKGYKGNLRVSESFIWDREKGLVTQNTYVPDENDLH